MNFRVFRVFRENHFGENPFHENPFREKIPSGRYSEEVAVYGDLLQCRANPGSRIRSELELPL